MYHDDDSTSFEIDSTMYDIERMGITMATSIPKVDRGNDGEDECCSRAHEKVASL